MDDREFYEQAEAIVRQLMSRIPQKYVDGFEGTLIGGEHEMAIENLVYTVVDDKIPISSEERDILYRLVQDMRGNEHLLAKLEGVIATGLPMRTDPENADDGD